MTKNTSSDGATPIRWETVEQLAERLQMSVYNIQRAAKLGYLPAHKLPGGRRWLFDPQEVDAAMKADVRNRWSEVTPGGDEAAA